MVDREEREEPEENGPVYTFIKQIDGKILEKCRLLLTVLNFI